MHDFTAKKDLPNKRTYGEVARTVAFPRSVAEAQTILGKQACKRLDTPLKPKPDSQASPLVQFACEDGSLFRFKPAGDPANPYRSWPHGSKSVRYPYDGDPLDFEQEAFKVDRNGRAVPKWPNDLAPGVPPDAWGEAAHFDLVREN